MPDRDNPGVPAPPPLIYGGALFAGLALNAVLASPRIPPKVGRPVGIVLLATGGLVAGSFINAFRRAHTTVDVRKPATNLVTEGHYRFNRNPG